MRWLKLLLAINGVVFVLYAVSNTLAPTSYFLPSDAPGYAIAVVRVVSVAYLALGLIQLGMWMVTDRLAVRIVAGASLVFAAAFAGFAVTVGSGSSDPYHQFAMAGAAGNVIVAILYAILLYRERAGQA